MKSMHPFKSYWVETKSVTMIPMMQNYIWSLRVCHAVQATQKDEKQRYIFFDDFKLREYVHAILIMPKDDCLMPKDDCLSA